MYYLFGENVNQSNQQLIQASENLHKLIYLAELSLVQTKRFYICTIKDTNNKLIWESTEHMLTHNVLDIQELMTIQPEEVYNEPIYLNGID
jgi:hypothetical protein